MERKTLMLDYIKKFEQMIAKGVKENIFTKAELVSIRGSRLGKTKFGVFIGFLIDSDIDFVIDYYGFFKRSKGFADKIKEYHENIRTKQIKAIETIVVHFPSLRIEHIAELDSSLVEEFPKFKAILIQKRGFKKL